MSTNPRHRRVSRVPLRHILAGVTVVGFIGTVVLAGLTGLQTTALTLLTLVAAFNLVMSSAEVKWRMHSHRTPEARDEMRFPAPTTAADSGISFGLILPALKEQRVIGRTMQRLAQTTYDAVTNFVSLRGFDTETIKVAMRVANQLPEGSTEVLVHNYNQEREKGKPYQLNFAWRHIRAHSDANVIGVFDAEDDVHPELLAHVARVFQDHPDVDIVQAGVQLMNLDLDTTGAGFFRKRLIHLRGWFCLHNVLEYFFWFSSRMAFQVEQGIVPLGGNTVFIRRSMLEKTGGWPTTLTEDCSLGIQAGAFHGAKVHAIYDPRFVTREETPHSVGALVDQRERWDQGFWEEFLKGFFRELDTLKKRLMAGYILCMPFIQAFNGVMLPISIAIMAFGWIKGPVALVLFMFTPLVPVLMTMVLQVAALQEFVKLYGKKLYPRHYVSLIIGFYPYQILLAWAAIRAMRNTAAGHNDWKLTSHYGLHHEPEIDHSATGIVAPIARTATEEGAA